MRILLSLFTIVIAAGASVSIAQPPAARPDPLVRENATQKVSEHVFIIPDNNVPMVPNVGIVVGDQAALIIDTGMGARNGAAVLREARKAAGTRPLFLATTHVHPEHDLGAQAFPAETTMIRARTQVEEIADEGLGMADRFRAMSPLNAELLKDAAFRPADVTFDDTYTLDLGGGVRVRLFAMGFNHTRGDTAFLVEPDAVLFSGDIVMTRLPNINGPAARLAQWLSSLDRLEALKPRLIVPSHGPTGDLSLIGPTRAYLRARPAV